MGYWVDGVDDRVHRADDRIQRQIANEASLFWRDRI
jgi:hypothetical protein